MEKNVLGFGVGGEIEFRQAGTEAELRIIAIVLPSSPTIAKPHVSGSLFFLTSHAIANYLPLYF
jgi:hypothetical protein